MLGAGPVTDLEWGPGASSYTYEGIDLCTEDDCIKVLITDNGSICRTYISGNANILMGEWVEPCAAVLAFICCNNVELDCSSS